MTLRVVEEGVPFDVTGEDRAHLARALRGSLQWREDGVVIWGLVGHIRLPSGATLVVRSKKAPTACILSWASYVDPSLADLKNLRRLEGVGDEGDVGEALACLLVRELLSVASAHGLRRRYRRVTSRSATLRGSVDFAALSRAGGDLSRTPCITWERLPKTPLNQLFAQALRLIQRTPQMRQAVGRLLTDLETALCEVAPAVDPDLLAGRRPLERDELPFAAACALARLLLCDAGMGAGGADLGLGFIARLDSLFERAVVRALQNAGLPVEPKHPAPYSRLDEQGGRVGKGHFQLDCFLPNADGRGVVIDAKYKSMVSPANIDQMVTYCHLVGVERAVLVFPAGQIQDRRGFELRNPRGGRIRIALVEFDTSGRTVAEWRTHGNIFAEGIIALSSQ